MLLARRGEAIGTEACGEARARGRTCGSAEAFVRALTFCGGATV